MSQYEKGVRVENKIKEFLVGEGYKVLRSAGSKGAFDIVAYNGHVVRFIQAKHTEAQNAKFIKERAFLDGIPVPPLCSVELWVHRPRLGFTDIYTRHNDQQLYTMEYPSNARVSEM